VPWNSGWGGLSSGWNLSLISLRRSSIPGSRQRKL
jgi:hypothetical protein